MMRTPSRRTVTSSPSAEERYVLAEADDQRRAVFCDVNPIRLVIDDKGQRIGAFETFNDVLQRFNRIADAFQFLPEQVRDDFGVGIGTKGDALGEQFLLQFLVIFDNAVVNQSQALRLVRMGVFARRQTVGRPTGVTDADLRFRRKRADRWTEIVDFTRFFGDRNFVVMQHGDAR
jgi:hypothetical protein